MQRLHALLTLAAIALAPGGALAQEKPSGKAPVTAQGTEPLAQGSAREKALSGSKGAGQVQGTVKVEEDKEGVKSYTFGALELEGRLKSPQILYFLRRVRAEFDPTGLGHRSFLRELSDTRRHRSVR